MKKTTLSKNEEQKKENLGANLKKLGEIAEWLEAQERSEEPDFDEGLAKVREAATLIAASRARLTEVENEFQEIVRQIEEKRDEDIGSASKVEKE